MLFADVRGYTSLTEELAPAEVTVRAQAGPGELFVDTETYAAVARDYPNAERRELELKGKSAPVETFRIAV